MAPPEEELATANASEMTQVPHSSGKTIVDAKKAEDAPPGAISDKDLLQRAEEKAAAECYLAAGQLLQQVSDKSLLTDYHRHILEIAQRGAKIKDELFQEFQTGGWHKQTEIHGRRDTCIYYKVNDDASLVVRIETPIESSLLNPLLAVFNETDMYASWMPSFKFPRLGVQESEKMKEFGRGHQVVRVRIAMPFPFHDRECVQHAVAIDSIETTQEDDDDDGCIVIAVQSYDGGENVNGFEIPLPERRVRRVFLEAGIVIRPCPADHPALKKSRNQYDGEKLLLVQVIQQMDAHVAGVPMSMINFFTRTVLGTMWGSLLQVAEDVREGKRPAFTAALEEHRELYDWVGSRVQVMLDQIHN